MFATWNGNGTNSTSEGFFQVLKMYAWENKFMEKIRSIRDGEISTLRAYGVLSAMNVTVSAFSPFVVGVSITWALQ